MKNGLVFNLASSDQIEGFLCARIAQIRISRNISQKKLADEAGVAVKTVGRMERGEGVSLDSFIRVMQALGLTGHLQALLPDPSIRPMERIRNKKIERKRSRQSSKNGEESAWSWGNQLENKS